MEYYKCVLKIVKVMGDKVIEGSVYGNIGIVY